MRKKLSEILNGQGDGFRERWRNTQAAADFAPLPPGDYIAHVKSGELFTAKSGTPGYKVAFRVAEGEYAGRLLWIDFWLTPAALSMTKRDLARLGISDPEHLEKPIVPGMRCKVKVALRRDDDGTERNRVVTFTYICVDKPEADPFAPVIDEKGGPKS